MDKKLTETFLRDIARHEMEIIRDDGVHRHVRFKRPGTTAMHFDLVTWPGVLCYTGDMGTYVFSRIRDMFEFFRCSNDEKLFRIDRRYWAEKLVSIDPDGAKEYSADLFRENIKDVFDRYAEGDELSEAERAELWAEVISDVLFYADHGEVTAISAAMDFAYNKRRPFPDFYEYNCRDFTHRFNWCCHALRWGIAQYDKAKAEATPA